MRSGENIVPDNAPDCEKRRLPGIGPRLEEVLPHVTADDRPDPADEDLEERDRWFWENRPPHHDVAW
jgi:hypothetical protein